MEITHPRASAGAALAFLRVKRELLDVLGQFPRAHAAWANEWRPGVALPRGVFRLLTPIPPRVGPFRAWGSALSRTRPLHFGNSYRFIAKSDYKRIRALWIPL